MAHPRTDPEILNELGVNALKALGYDELLIRQWRRRGIAWRQRHKVQRLALERGIAVPPDFLDNQRGTVKKAKPKAAAKKRRA